MGPSVYVAVFVLQILCATAFVSIKFRQTILSKNYVSRSTLLSATVSSKPPIHDIRVSNNEWEYEEVLRRAGIGRSETYWSAQPRLEKRYLEAVSNNDSMKIEEYKLLQSDLAECGFNRRLWQMSLEYGNVDSLLRDCAEDSMASQNTKERSILNQKRLNTLRQQTLKSMRQGWMRLVPQPLHKYIDYLHSMRSKRTAAKDITLNLMMSAFFSVIMWSKQTLMTTLKWGYSALFATMALLYIRNLPEAIDDPAFQGMDPEVLAVIKRRKKSPLSKVKFISAAAVTAVYTLPSFLVCFGLLALIPTKYKLSLDNHFLYSAIVSTTTAAYFTAYYDVYEEEGKEGERWRRAKNGQLPAAVEKELRTQIYGTAEGDINDQLYEKYSFDYNPELTEERMNNINAEDRRLVESSVEGGLVLPNGRIDENKWDNLVATIDEEPARSKYPPHISEQGEAGEDGNYIKWRKKVEDSRKEAVSSRKDMFGEEAPRLNWNIKPMRVVAETMRNLVQSPWKKEKPKYKKDMSEFEPFLDTYAFRDARPEWLMRDFPVEVYSGKATGTNEAAREFGTYRRGMHKIDKKVVLRDYDGVTSDDKKKKEITGGPRPSSGDEDEDDSNYLV